MGPLRLRTAGVVAAVCVLAAACSSISGDPIGNGNHVVTDVDPTPAPPQQGTGETVPAENAPIGDSSAYSGYDAYVQRTICATFPETGDAGDGAAAAAKADAAARAGDAGAYASDGGGSCEMPPAACAGNLNCPCLIVALGPELPC